MIYMWKRMQKMEINCYDMLKMCWKLCARRVQQNKKETKGLYNRKDKLKLFIEY